jgi:hypothetical protein
MAQPTSFVRARVRGAVDRVLVRVRGALDLPSRAEMIDLTERLEQLDRRISELAAERVAELSRTPPALPAPEVEEPEAPSEPQVETVARVARSDQSAPERVRRGSSRRSSARTGKR